MIILIHTHIYAYIYSIYRTETGCVMHGLADSHVEVIDASDNEHYKALEHCYAQDNHF